MDRYIFKNIYALNNARILANIASISSFDVLHSITFNKDFMNETELESFARINLNEFISQLYGCIEQDIYYMLNYTYDFMMKYYVFGQSELNYIDDAISYWGEYDKEIINDDKNVLFNRYLKAINKNKPFFHELIIYDKSHDILKVSKLCPNFGLYVYKNVRDMFWYRSGKNEYDKYLLSRFLKVEECKFSDSEYYLLEQITNINSVLTLSDLLSQHISTDTAKSLMENTEDSRVGKEINKLILSVASSPLIYSKSDILKKVFDETKKHMNLETDFIYAIKYITIQFNMISNVLSCSLYDELHNRFPKNCINMTDEELKKEKMINEQKFVSTHPNYLKNCLIKNKSLIKSFSEIKKANKKDGYLNVYIQKSFIDIINAPPKDSAMDWEE